MLARHGLLSALFFLLAPGTVAGLVPYLLTQWESHDWHAYTLPAQAVGAALMTSGLGALAHSFYRFVVEGHGTPAPVASPTTLVVHGFYRHVRNPMYVAVVMVILGQGLWFRRFILLGYAAAVWLLFHLFVVLYEEPTLQRTFGAPYDAYRSRVPRWWPRARRFFS